jgi:uncharacterized repeat protein (TIGR03806 family)
MLMKGWSKAVHRPAVGLLGLCVLWWVLLACQKDPDPEPTDGAYVSDSIPYRNLSSYRLFETPISSLSPRPGILPYDLITPLFTDYAFKSRLVVIPKGQAARYQSEGVLEFPEHTFLVKSFYYPVDFRQPEGNRKIVETRLLFRRNGQWQAYTYRWNEAQTEATLIKGGAMVPVSWTHTDGSLRTVQYLVPNQNECKSCHNVANQLQPIGPKAMHLNHDYTYATGRMNQLARWQQAGMLTDLPSLATVPKLPNWTDSLNYSVADRARAYLDINCAHCHSPKGSASNAGINLSFSETNPTAWGVCKPPVAAGSGSGGRLFDIQPGKPDSSIMIFRMEMNDPDLRMPEVGRSSAHAEAVALLRQWIQGLDGSCR